MSKQPEALRLADALDGSFPEAAASSAVDELRRLHAVNQELLEALKLADALLSGANMNVKVVERKVRAAIDNATGE